MFNTLYVQIHIEGAVVLTIALEYDFGLSVDQILPRTSKKI